MDLRDQIRIAIGGALTAQEGSDGAADAVMEVLAKQQKPVEWQARSRPNWGNGAWPAWETCSEARAKDIIKTPVLHDWVYEARALYALPGAHRVPSFADAYQGAMEESGLAMSNVYREHGYNDREDYLSCIAEDYGLDLEQVVRPLADLLGPSEDFDGLVSALEDGASK